MGAEVLLAAVFCGALLYLSGRKLGPWGMGPRAFAILAALLFLSGLSLRLWLGYASDGFSNDIGTFKAWAAALSRYGFSEVYRQEDLFLDYPPGYLYVLATLEKLRQALRLPFESSLYTLVIKLPAILSDLFCGGALLWAGRKKLGETQGLFLAAVYLFCPVVFLNSAQWGQVDSVTTAILLCSVLLLYREWYVPSALLYGLSIACKPQMLIFAPLYLFFAVKQRRWGKLLLGIVCAVGAVLLTAAPFTEGWDFLWLLERYKSTMDYYNYYSVNAYNFWALIGWNWRGLPEGLSTGLLTLAAPVLATALCGAFLFLSRRKDALFACPALLMGVMYLFGLKMHERYLFPAFLFLLLCFAFTPDKRLPRAFGLTAAANYLNVAYVLYLFREKGGNYDPNTPLIRCLSGVQAAALLYLFYTLFAVYVRGQLLSAQPKTRRWEAPAPIDARFTGRDWLAVGLVTLVYGLFAFWHLGSHVTAVTPWAPAEGDSVVLHAEEPCDMVRYLPGIAPDDSRRGAKFGVDLLVEVSKDGKAWTECGNLSDGGTYVFDWAQYRLEDPSPYVRLTAMNGSVVLNEAALKLQGKTVCAEITAEGPGASALIDEQEVVPKYTTYENSSYFDEIYHARTAYEHILGLEPYENTHPPLGKYIISLGIRAFGMNPFGWRFMGALFGVLMLPVLYHLLKQLFGRTGLCCAGTLWFAFDFMHFTQTRIATIDTYAVFFLLLMYDCMVVFLRRDILRDSMKKLLPPLLLCGLFTGLGIASKWTAAYGALGLAALFFGKLLLSWRDIKRREPEQLKALGKRAVFLCLWCCLFFLVIPFGLYFAAYLPITTLPHNVSNVWGAFWNYQTTMFNYHSQLRAEHYFASPWYEWPFDVRPIWYFSSDPVNTEGQYSTISALGNPLLWWAGVPALLGAAALWVKERRAWAGAALCGFLSVYLPWVLVPRLTFIYHYFTAVPFLVLALAGVFSLLPRTRLGSQRLGPAFLTPLGRRIELEEEPAGSSPTVSLANIFLWVFTAGVIVLFLIYFPVISGAPADKPYTDALRLFSTWYF